MKAIDVEIELIHQQGQAYKLGLTLNDPAEDAEINLLGNQQISVTLDPEEARQHLTGDSAYGKWLGDKIFGEPTALAGLNRALNRSESQQKPLRLLLKLGQGLHGLAWEALAVEDIGQLALKERLRMSRFLSSSSDRPARRPFPEQITALATVAAPTDVDTFGFAEVDRKLFLGLARGFMGDFEVLESAGNLDAIRQTIKNRRDDGIDLLYLTCHGKYLRDQPHLYLEDENGLAKPTPGQELADLLADLPTLPRLVVLASCQSAGSSGNDDSETLNALGPLLIEIGVPAVIAMQGNFTIDTATEFLPKFFAELQVDGYIDRALAAARMAVRDRGDAWMPVLFMRLRDGSLWREDDAPPAVQDLVLDDYNKFFFVNRQQQIKDFAEAIIPKEAGAEPLRKTKKVALDVYANAGMGKSWFLHRLYDYCLEEFGMDAIPVVKMDFSQTRDIQGFLSLIRHLRDLIGKNPKEQFAKLNDTINQYATGANDGLIENIVGAFTPAQLIAICEKAQLPIDASSSNANIKILAEGLVDELGRQRRLPELIAALNKQPHHILWEFGDEIRKENKMEWKFAIKQISAAFFQDLGNILDNHESVIFLFDSLNNRHTASDTRGWIRAVFLPWVAGLKNEKILAVITQEKGPGLERTNFKLGNRILELELNPLAKEDIEIYITERRSLDLTDEDWERVLEQGTQPSILAMLAHEIEERNKVAGFDGGDDGEESEDDFWDTF